MRIKFNNIYQILNFIININPTRSVQCTNFETCNILGWEESVSLVCLNEERWTNFTNVCINVEWLFDDIFSQEKGFESFHSSLRCIVLYEDGIQFLKNCLCTQTCVNCNSKSGRVTAINSDASRSTCWIRVKNAPI